MSAGAIYFGSAVLIALIGAALFVWALFADRSRGRKRCPKCWYDMSGAVNLRCPECGRQLTSEKQLLKTRRRWKVAFVTLLPFALAGFLALQPKVQRDGWWSVMPTTVMLLYFQFQQDDAVIEAIHRRMSVEHVHPAMGTPMFVPEDDKLHRWQWLWLARRTVRALDEDRLTLTGRRTCIAWAGVSRDTVDDASLRERLQRAIASQLTRDEPTIRATSAIVVVNADNPEGTIALVLPLVDDADDRVRGAAVSALRSLAFQSKSDDAVSTVIRLLEHPDVLVRDYAASGLYFLTESFPEWRAEYEQALRRAHRVSLESGGLRHRIVSTLMRLTAPEEWLPCLREAIQSGDAEVRAEGLLTVSEGLVDASEFLDAVLRELLADDATVMGRLAAAWTLHYRLNTELLQPHQKMLAGLIHHPEPAVRDAAMSILTRLNPERAADCQDDP